MSTFCYSFQNNKSPLEYYKHHESESSGGFNEGEIGSSTVETMPDYPDRMNGVIRESPACVYNNFQVSPKSNQLNQQRNQDLEEIRIQIEYYLATQIQLVKESVADTIEKLQQKEKIMLEYFDELSLNTQIGLEEVSQMLDNSITISKQTTSMTGMENLNGWPDSYSFQQLSRHLDDMANEKVESLFSNLTLSSLPTSILEELPIHQLEKSLKHNQSMLYSNWNSTNQASEDSKDRFGDPSPGKMESDVHNTPARSSNMDYHNILVQVHDLQQKDHNNDSHEESSDHFVLTEPPHFLHEEFQQVSVYEFDPRFEFDADQWYDFDNEDEIPPSNDDLIKDSEHFQAEVWFSMEHEGHEYLDSGSSPFDKSYLKTPLKKINKGAERISYKAGSTSVRKNPTGVKDSTSQCSFSTSPISTPAKSVISTFSTISPLVSKTASPLRSGAQRGPKPSGTSNASSGDASPIQRASPMSQTNQNEQNQENQIIVQSQKPQHHILDKSMQSHLAYPPIQAVSIVSPPSSLIPSKNEDKSNVGPVKTIKVVQMGNWRDKKPPASAGHFR